MTRIQLKRGTRAQLDAAAADALLAVGEPYLITDEGRLAVAMTVSTFTVMLKEGEGGVAGPAGPAAPTLVSPAAGADGGKVFTVGAYSHPLDVPKWCTQIQRARDAAFTVDTELSPIATQDVSTTVTLTWAVRTGTNYWRARDIDVFGVAGEWSAVRAYNTPVGEFTGGTLTQDGDYYVRTFTTSGTLTVSEGGIADVLLVAGGGGGGGSVGGGGGGGGVVFLPGQAFAAGTYSVVVGAGGAGGIAATKGGNGGNSSITGLTAAVGGGGGGMANGGAGLNGGSGGGSGYSNTPGGAGTAGQGYDGGTAGEAGLSSGGGGAGGAGKAPVGTVSGDGGPGFACAISPARTHYAGGGSAGGIPGYSTDTGVAVHGGGRGVQYGNGADGTPNTGGGGGGGGQNSSTYNGGAGGSGVVIIRYQA